MSYTKNTWETGDVVTAAKLNNMENGIAAACQVLFVHESVDYSEDSTTYTLDKTWQEIHDALEVGIAVLFKVNNETEVGQMFISSAYLDEASGEFYVELENNYSSYTTSTANGYPSYEKGVG